MSEDKTEDVNENAPETKFETLIRGMSDTQVAAAKATVDVIHNERNGPDLSSMSDNEFDAYARKLFRGDK